MNRQWVATQGGLFPSPGSLRSTAVAPIVPIVQILVAPMAGMTGLLLLRVLSLSWVFSVLGGVLLGGGVALAIPRILEGSSGSQPSAPKW